MSTLYNFVKLDVCPPQLTTEINAAGLSQVCEYVLIENADQVTVSMVGPLAPAEITTLGVLVTNHTCNAPVITPTQEALLPPGEPDSTRNNEVLSYAEMSFFFAESSVSNKDWIQIGHASDSDSGHIFPYPATITRVSAHVESQEGSGPKAIDMYINNVVINDVLTFGGPATQQSSDDDDGDSNNNYYDQHRIRNDLNIQVNTGEKVRMRGAMSSGQKLKDTVVDVWYKWRII